ncbi:MAG TPA: hypothetical protein RMH99_20250 [Sandaracinaceae bacterium LLY-WYZ-13_1]|nr:hypothetical protein [Sandaracinaceae bacterium LLY-WYZ-13_1]
MRSNWESLTPLLTALALVGGCAPKPGLAPDEGDDPYKGRGADALSRDGRWVPSETIRRIGEAQDGRYEAAPAWDPDRCGGGLLTGTRALGEHLTSSFDGASRYEGYNCRPNTADRGRMSVHGTGRALDVYVPLDRGDADNDLGDPVAHWLIEHATEIGVQLIIWDRTKWNISYAGRKDAPYGGAHPHHDHLHIELTSEGAAGRTPWFAGETPDEADPPPTTPIDPACNDTCPYARDGECDDASGTGLCASGTDCTDCRASAGGGAPTLPSAGLTLDGMAIPYRGLENGTLEAEGMGAREPLGERTIHLGAEMVRGRISHFGGPADRWVSATEEGTITGERLRDLNDPVSPTAAVLRARPEDYYYVAMRWRYAPHGRSWLSGARVLVVAPATGRAVVLRPVDWGPHTRTGRIVDASPQALEDLGVATDAEVLVAWAPPGTPLGPTSGLPGAPSEPADDPDPEAPPAGDPASGCTDTCRWATDGACDDGGAGAAYSVCALGTDCSDCGPRDGSPAPEPTTDETDEAEPHPGGSCTDTCVYAGDGDCDDGGPGADYALCAYGSDCTDCGPRGTTADAEPTGALGDSCGSVSECASGLSCLGSVSQPAAHCCVPAGSSCGAGSDCCGYMDCLGGRCACRSAGRACLDDADCCSGACHGGRCG